jgi:hypothetical protein
MVYAQGMEKERITKATFRIAESSWREFRSYCVREGRDTSDMVRELIQRYIMEHRKQG